MFIQDSSATNGDGLSGLTSGSSGLTGRYVRPLSAPVNFTFAAQTETGAYSSGGFVEMTSTAMPGVYRLDLPDGAVAAGASSVVVMLFGATNMAPVLLEVQLDDMSEPSSVPAADVSLETKVNWLYTLARNKITQTSTTQTLRNDADAANIATSATSDSAGTFTRAEWQ